MIVDLFAGPGGWSEGLRQLDRHDIGIEWDRAACATRHAAGHLTIRADVATYPAERFHGAEGLIASPPCPDWSAAGSGLGRAGTSGHLVDTVPAWVDTVRPRWILCEQVPPALEVWQEHAHTYRALGYSVWTGVLNSADFGVPQTRRRAILIAHRDQPALPPPATHARNPTASLFGTLEPWVSMADALGWDGITTGQETMRGAGMRERYGARPMPMPSDPSETITGKSRSWKLVEKQRRHNDIERDMHERAMTIVSSADNGDFRFESWPWTTPATTVVGDPRITARCAHGYGDQGRDARTTDQVQAGDYTGVEPITLKVWQALVLQSFPVDYPVQGTKTAQFQQVGNAVPPLLARRLLEQVL